MIVMINTTTNLSDSIFNFFLRKLNLKSGKCLQITCHCNIISLCQLNYTHPSTLCLRKWWTHESIIINVLSPLCLCVMSRTATWGTCSAHAISSKEAVPMTRWSTAQPYCPAAPSTPTLRSPTPWLSAATVVPAGQTVMSAHTEPAGTELGAQNQSDVSSHIPVRAATWYLSDCFGFALLLFFLKLQSYSTWFTNVFK